VHAMSCVVSNISYERCECSTSGEAAMASEQYWDITTSRSPLPAGPGHRRGTRHAPLQAHCHRGLGTLSAKLGRREQACTELSIAIALYRAMEMTFWLPETEAARAQVEWG